MKLEVGMYVRTKYGIIAKCTDIRVNRYMFDRIILENGYYNDWEFIDIPEEKSLIKKASHNIIDLIEERDFVKVRIDGIFTNWFMVDLFEDENENQELGIGCYEDGLLNSISEYRPLNTLEILEVLTKEQFESASYKVKE